jgi:hypothetical protein
MSDNNGVVVIESVLSVQAEPVVTFDFAAVSAVYPWFADLAEDVQNAAREQWQEAAVDDATLMPTDGMDDQEQWEKGLESWMHDRDTVNGEAEIERCEADYNATVKAAIKVGDDVATGKQRLGVLCHHALKVYMEPNHARGTPYKRAAVLKEMLVDLRDSMDSTEELGSYVRYGACSAVLFGTTKELPVVGRDGITRAKLSKDVKAMPWTIITALSPLVQKTASDIEERWQVLPHVSADVRTLVESIKADSKMPRATIGDAVAKLCHENALAEVAKNPHNKAAAKEAEKWEAKLPEADASEEVDVKQPQGDAGTVDVVETPAPTPNAPQSLINPPMPPAEDTGDINMDAELGKTIGSMLMDDCEDPIAVLRSQFRAMLDDGGMDEAQTLCIKGMLTLAARHAAGQQTTVEESK